VSLNTDEIATCRYSDVADIPYGSMVGIFSTTDGTSHSTDVGGLGDGLSYTYHVRCIDLNGNANGSDFPISFSVAAGGQDTTSRRAGDSLIDVASGCGLAAHDANGSAMFTGLLLIFLAIRFSARRKEA
jgi:hypothetical protein